MTKMGLLFAQAFVDKFSQDLAAEVRALGVTVQTVHPGFVCTKMPKLKKPSITAPMPDVYVSGTLRTLGLEDRTAGYWVHKIQVSTCIVGFSFLF